MNTQKRPEVLLPVGEKPGWDTSLAENEDSTSIKSIAESRVLAQSLQQSRQKWLYHTFPKFSSKARGSKSLDAIPPPPHTIQTRGKCDLEIGPHIFSDTVVYEVHYLPPQVSYSTQAQQSSNTSITSWQTTTPYGSSLSYPPVAANGTKLSTAGGPAPSSTPDAPLMTSLTSVTTITPSLINQVNSAASSNPILANLLQLAAAGRATPDQLKTLGLLIQSLASAGDPSLATSSSSPSQPQSGLQSSSTPVTGLYQAMPSLPPVKEFDVVIEFRETTSERWILPRGAAVYNRSAGTGASSLTVRIPFNRTGTANSLNVSQTPNDGELHQATTFRLGKVPLAVSDTLVRWIGGEEKMKENEIFLKSLATPDRMYLGYCLPQGPLMAQLQMFTQPHFAMKPLKHGPAPIRATRQKRSHAKVKAIEMTPNGRGQEPSNRGHGRTTISQVQKKQKTSYSHSHEIQCLVCKQTNVPLILGGRYCRPCVDSGRAVIDSTYPFNSQLTTIVKEQAVAAQDLASNTQTPALG